MGLLSTDHARIKCSDMMMNSESGIILSAFFSKPAADWIIDHKPNDLTVVIRGRLSDFTAGAASIEAIRLLISSGHKVFFNFELHAKIFYFGDEILLGSSNLTANGLNLLDTGGNIELSSVISASESNKLIVQRIIKNSIRIDPITLQKLTLFLDKSDLSTKIDAPSWPKEIFNQNHNPTIWCSDLPPHSYDKAISEGYCVWGEIARLSENNRDQDASKLFRETNAYRWLIRLIIPSLAHGESFGAVSAALHAELNDDPSPMRKDIKILQGNFYTFIERIQSDLEIFQPNFSQIVRIKHAAENML